MDDLGHVVHDRIVPPVKEPVQLYCLVSDHLDPLCQVSYVLFKLVLHLFGADRLMNVRLKVHLLSVILLDVIELKVIHRLEAVILLMDLVTNRHIA